ncbi:MAG: hydantoinase/oxoprolinase family protein [Tepidisphaeraceae bacterium]
MLSKALESAGFHYLSVSSLLSSQIKILQRAETSVANAYLDPIIRNYISGIESKLSGAALNIMTSAGSLVKSNSFYPKDSLLSGPAGGVVGAADQALKSGKQKVIAFDMGGTSTDVSLYDQRFDYRFESRVSDFKILSPSLAIETIAAGGGSICDFDGHRLTVGPHSAGAFPDPACYGAGGPLTITDVNVLLGRLNPKNFAIPIDVNKSQVALNDLLKKIKKRTGKSSNASSILQSLAQIANEKMAEAIRKISVQEGHDPRAFTLLSFGGAGGQHACALADILDMKEVLVPYDAGLLSAYGIGHAAVDKFEEKLVLQPYRSVEKTIPNILKSLFNQASQGLIKEGFSESKIFWKKTLIFLRFAGQDTPIEIDYQTGDDLIESFRKKYVSIFGHWIEREIEVESIRVIASVRGQSKNEVSETATRYKPAAEGKQWMTTTEKKVLGNIYRWESLKAGAQIIGPALVTSNNSTTFIEKNWEWFLDAHNNAHLTRRKGVVKKSKHSAEAALELFTNRFTALAQEMGALLQRTSFSVNVKERLDFSCALLDPEGYLVVNAPHIPVHLGSMGVCVREVAKVIAMNEGDVVITNHPAFGGSHLPDVTLIKPVFYKKKLVGYVANRAHHAEIGGSKPGSMPADATTLEQEGVIIKPAYLVKGNIPQWDTIKQIRPDCEISNAINTGKSCRPKRCTGCCQSWRQRPSGDLFNAW